MSRRFRVLMFEGAATVIVLAVIVGSLASVDWFRARDAVAATTAPAPRVTPDAAVALYNTLGWAHITIDATELVCVPRSSEQHLDAIVTYLHREAKRVLTCS